MCGIFGFAGKSSWKTSALLQALCIMDEVRGRHSTGLVIQTGKGGCFFRKKAVRGREFVAQGNTAFLFHNEYGLCLGHNRFATAGAINDRNAHPFGVKVGGVWNYGVHNGIVGGKRRIANAYRVNEAAVDSEVVFRAIAKMQNREKGVTDAIEDITDFISGSADFAFAYLEASERAIYLWRSPERPLAVFDARKLGLGRWFCSTEEIFVHAWCLLRGALGDIRKVTCFEAKPFRLYRVADDGVFEVDAVKELKHQSRAKKESGSLLFRQQDLLDGESLQEMTVDDFDAGPADAEITLEKIIRGNRVYDRRSYF